MSDRDKGNTNMQIERLNVFATAEEIERIKLLQRASGAIPGLFSSSIEAAHRSALAHGLPEIPGYYGIDLSTGELIKAARIGESGGRT